MKTLRVQLDIPENFRVRENGSLICILDGKGTVSQCIDSVSKQLSSIINQRDGFDIDKHILVLQSETGARTMLLDDHGRLKDYVDFETYQNNAVLKVVAREQTISFIDPSSNQVYKVEVNCDAYGKFNKWAAQDVIEERTKQKVKSLEVIGKQKEGAWFVTCQDIVAREGKDFGVVVFSRKLYVAHKDKEYPVEFQPSDTIADIKGKLAVLIPDIAVGDMSLFMMQQQSMYRNSEEVNLDTSSGLFEDSNGVSIRTRETLYQDYDSDSEEVNSDTHRNVSKAQSFENYIVDDSCTMDEYHIRDGATLKLQTNNPSRNHDFFSEENLERQNNPESQNYRSMIAQNWGLWTALGVSCGLNGTALFRGIELSCKISIPASLLAGLLMGAAIYGYQGPER